MALRTGAIMSMRWTHAIRISLGNVCQLQKTTQSSRILNFEIRKPQITRFANTAGKSLKDANYPLLWTIDPESGMKKYLGGKDDSVHNYLRELFRLDMYGNVVSIEANTFGALTYFDVDHLFPWSRGGRSVQANFAAVHYGANRWAKSDKLIPTLNCREGERVRENNCLRGISRTQFYNLFEYAFSVVGCDNHTNAKGRNKSLLERSDRNKMLHIAIDVAEWLTHGSYAMEKKDKEQIDAKQPVFFGRSNRGQGHHLDLLRNERKERVESTQASPHDEMKYGLVSDFQVAVGHTTEGEQLYKILKRRYEQHEKAEERTKNILKREK